MANELAKSGANSVKQYLASPAVKQRIEDLLKDRASQFTTSLTAMVGADNNLAQCQPASLFMAALTAAALDLPINKNLAFAHIVPYRNNSAGVTEAQFQLGWKGYVQLAQRSGQYKTIAATAVYNGQLVAEDPLLGNTYDWKAKRSDDVIGYVAMFKLVNGFEKELYMSLDEIKAHADRYSKAYNHGKGYGPWRDNFDAMALKTVVKLLISKWGPMSVEMQRAVEVDSAVIKESGEPEYIDGELSDVNATEEQKAAIIAANQEDVADTTDDQLAANMDATTGEAEQTTLVGEPKAPHGDNPRRKAGK